MGKEPAAKLDGGCGRCVLAPELGRAASSLTHPSSWERGKATLQDTALHPAATRGSSWLPQDGGDTAELPGACPRALRHCWHCRRQQGTGRAQCGDSPVSACPCCSLAVSTPHTKLCAAPARSSGQVLATGWAGGWCPAPRTGQRAGGSSRVPPGRQGSAPLRSQLGAGAPHGPISEWLGGQQHPAVVAGLSGQRGATGLGVLPGEAPALPGEERGFCLPSAPGVTEGAASPRAALHAGGMGTACYLPVTEPDPLAFAAFASSHGGNKQRVLQACSERRKAALSAPEVGRRPGRPRSRPAFL